MRRHSISGLILILLSLPFLYAQTGSSNFENHTATYWINGERQDIPFQCLRDSVTGGVRTWVARRTSSEDYKDLPPVFRYSLLKSGNGMQWALGYHRGSFSRLSGPVATFRDYFNEFEGGEISKDTIKGTPYHQRRVMYGTRESLHFMDATFIPGIGFYRIEYQYNRNKVRMKLEEIDGVPVSRILRLPPEERIEYFPK